MKHVTSILLILLFSGLTGYTQKSPGELSNTDDYFIHQVNDDETLFSLSRKFNVQIKRIKELNRISPESNNIAIGDLLIIPVEPIQQETVDALENMDTIGNDRKEAEHVHIVVEGETLFSIAKSYQNVSTDSIRQWNNLSSDTLEIGQRLVFKNIGSSKSKSATISDSSKQDGSGTESFQKQSTKEKFLFGKKKSNQNPNKKEDKQTSEEQMDATATKSSHVDTTSQQAPFKELLSIYKEYGQKAYTKQSERGVATWLGENYNRGNANFYGLHKYAPVGSVIEVRNLMNNRKVYVKVIGRLSETDENRNVLVKVTEAAADYLNVLDDKFLVEVTSYSKVQSNNQ